MKPATQRKKTVTPMSEVIAMAIIQVVGGALAYLGILATVGREDLGATILDDASTTVGFLGQAGTQQNAYDRAGDYSISSNDVKYRLVSAFVICGAASVIP